MNDVVNSYKWEPFPFPLAVSEAPKVAAAPKKYQSYNPNFKTDEDKKEEVCALYCVYACS